MCFGDFPCALGISPVTSYSGVKGQVSCFFRIVILVHQRTCGCYVLAEGYMIHWHSDANAWRIAWSCMECHARRGSHMLSLNCYQRCSVTSALVAGSLRSWLTGAAGCSQGTQLGVPSAGCGSRTLCALLTCADIANGMRILHSAGTLHGDLAPRHVMLYSNHKVCSPPVLPAIS